MTKVPNNGSKNQSSPQGTQSAISGDNSKGNKRNKDQKRKPD
ncbi:hypothetical protein [Cytobacillus kochii]|nr:hypothetical protein [Cytobacillus kochii]